MHRILAASASLGVACASAHHATHPPLLERSIATPPLCTMSAPEHTRFLELRLAGGGPVFAHTGYSGEAWPRVDAMLVWRDGAWLAAAVSGDGLNVWAEVEATEREVLYAAELIDLGPVGIASLDTPLSVVGVDGDSVVVRPTHHAFEHFEPVGSVDRQVTCDALALTRPPETPDGYTGLLASLELEPTREASIHVPERVPLHASPSGEVLGHLLPDDVAQQVYVLEERDGWLRVVLGDLWTHVVWQGWVEASHEDPDAAYGIGGLGTRGTGAGTEPLWRACQERQPLFAQPEGAEPTHIGWMDPGTPFAVNHAQPDGATLPEGVVRATIWKTWLKPGDTLLFLPEAAAECANVE